MTQNKSALATTQESKSGVRLMVFLWLWIAIAVVFFVLITLSSLKVNAAMDNQRRITEKTVRCYRLAQQFQNGSDTLTYAVWRFAGAGDTRDAEAYLEEVNVNRTRDEAIVKLLQEGVTLKDLSFILEAKRYSNNLMMKELWALRLLYQARGVSPMPETIAAVKLSAEEAALSAEEQKELANAFLFGAVYTQMKSAIVSNVSLFYDRLGESLAREQKDAVSQTARAQNRQLQYDYGFVIWLFVLLLLLQKKLIHPVRIYSASLSATADRSGYPKLTPGGAYETRRLAMAFNDVLSKLHDVTDMLEQRNQELTVLSHTDYLTKVSNRLSMEDDLSRMLDGYRERKDAAIGFLMLDLDHFKVFNDTYGHPAGDEALRDLAGLLKDMVGKRNGIVSRIGGEEFFLILPDVNQQQLADFATDLLERVRLTPVGGHSITVSLGGYLWTGGPQSTKDMYVNADKALYQAKEQGRDRYVPYRE